MSNEPLAKEIQILETKFMKLDVLNKNVMLPNIGARSTFNREDHDQTVQG